MPGPNAYGASSCAPTNESSSGAEPSGLAGPPSEARSGLAAVAWGRRDLPAIQGSVLFLSTVFVIVNLITDLAYAKADPRVSYE